MVKLLRLMTVVGIVTRAVMEIVAMLMVTVAPVAVICISVCVIKHCVPTTQEHRDISNFSDVSA